MTTHQWSRLVAAAVPLASSIIPAMHGDYPRALYGAVAAVFMMLAVIYIELCGRKR